MTRIRLILIGILFFAFNPYRAVSQTSSSKPFFPFIEYSEFEGCESMKHHARQDDSTSNLKYVIYVHMVPLERHLASAIILWDQFNITAVVAPMNCSGLMYDHFYCYNDVVEQMMRRRLMRNFPRLIEHKADSLLRKMSSEALYHEVSRRRHDKE